jgi:hypothetical protein
VDDQLLYLRADVEANIDLPDFGQVAARGARIRRRRTVAVSGAVALVVAVVLVGVTRPFDSSQSVQPVHQPAPRIDSSGARVVLADPAAYVDTDASRVDGRGDVLSVVREDLSGSCPGTGASTALRWTGSGGRTHAWLELPRPVLALPDGFVVGAVGPDCDTMGASDARAYLVDSSGVPRAITWGAGAERICAGHPQDPRCRYDIGGRRGSVVMESHLPPGAVLLQRPAEGTMWARSADSRRMYWSTDGRSWRSRTTSLPKGTIVSASAAGERAVLAGDTSVEYTSDGGDTWHSRDLTAALSSVKIVDVDWTVTRNGYLLGVTQLVGRGDVMFRSTDPSWAHFAETGVHTSFGLVRPSVEGNAVFVPDSKGWVLSTDDGASWRRTPALP